ncbi:MAG: MFS transporter [Puniceicoccaceae bacterium]
MSTPSTNLSFREKAGFSAGEFGGSGLWQMLMTYIGFFFTDVFGISAGVVAFMFLAVRIFDGVNDPIMGMLSDRTETRHGKFRPYILWAAIPFGIIALALFWAPDLSDIGKVIYGYTTYTLMMVIYTVVMIPYSALSGVMTSDPQDRTSLNTFRFFGAFVAALIAKTLYKPMVAFFGQGNDVIGNRWTLAIFAIITVICFLIAFRSTRERVKAPKSERQSILRDIAQLSKNGPWVIILILSLVSLIYICIKGGIQVFYFKYYVGGERDLFPLFIFLSSLSTILGVMTTTFWTKRFEKKNVLIASYALSSIFAGVFLFLRPDQVYLIFGFEILAALTMGPIMPILWSMMADAADYSEWKHGERATGLVFSASTMAFKMGVAIGGFISMGVLGLKGFVANQDQSPEVLGAMKQMVSVYPAAGGVICMIALTFYTLTNDRLKTIEEDLGGRRETAQAD